MIYLNTLTNCVPISRGSAKTSCVNETRRRKRTATRNERASDAAEAQKGSTERESPKRQNLADTEALVRKVMSIRQAARILWLLASASPNPHVHRILAKKHMNMTGLTRPLGRCMPPNRAPTDGTGISRAGCLYRRGMTCHCALARRGSGSVRTPRLRREGALFVLCSC